MPNLTLPAAFFLSLGICLAGPRAVPDEWLEKTFTLSQKSPAVEWDFSKPEDRADWKPNSQVEMTPSPDGVILGARGEDPFIIARLPQPVKSPTAVGFVLRQREELMYLELFTAGPKENMGVRAPLRRLALGSDAWQTVWFVVEGGDLGALRLDSPGGKAQLELSRVVAFPLALPRSSDHPVLPEPNWHNTAYVVPIHESYDDARYDDASRRRDIQQLQEEIGPGRLYIRIGFSASSPQSWHKTKMQDKIPLLEEAGLVWHAHHHVGNHSIGRHPEILTAVRKDRRNAAWSVDGNCRGVATSWADLHVFNEEGLARTSVLACISRLNTDVIAGRRSAVRWLNETQGHAWAAKVHPEVMVSAGCSVENELPQSPYAWGCYSPYSVQEFQDWLRHRGNYENGRGASEALIGPLITIRGQMRSAFFDDPSPADPNGTGPSFNAWFQTSFNSWKLEYWDLADFPPGTLPWAEDLSNTLPNDGEQGNFPGQGFDAPRVVKPNGRYWLAWDNEDAIKPGYRQHSIQAWNADVVADFAATGFPREHLFTHQIPAEFLSKRLLPPAEYKTGQSLPLLRRFTTASPTWTADDAKGPFRGFGLGITAFDYSTDEPIFARARACDANWALLEYHPDSPAQPRYDRCLDSLRGLYRQRVHVLAPGWWGYKKPPFLFNGTEFAKALKDWIRNPSGFDESDQPWDSFVARDYAPPPVHGIKVDRAATGVVLTWSDHLWPDLNYAKWTLWREWRGGIFAIRRYTTNHPEGEIVAEVPGTQFRWEDPSPPEKASYSVTARRTLDGDLEGAISEKVSAN